VRLKVTDVAPEDFSGSRNRLRRRKIDASYHWFQHTIYGVRHNLPVKAVILLNDAPGAKIMVAKRLSGEIKGAADFKGRARCRRNGLCHEEGMLTNYLAVKRRIAEAQLHVDVPGRAGPSAGGCPTG